MTGDAFAAGLHAGYLVAGAAMLASTVLAITLLQAFRHGLVATPPSDAQPGAESETTAAHR